MKIVKYEKTNCRPCNEVQYFFDQKGIPITRVSIEEEPEKAMAQHIKAVPTTVLLDDNGTEVSRALGYNFGQLSDMVKRLTG